MKFSPTAVSDQLMSHGDDGDDDYDREDNQLSPDMDHNSPVIYSSPEANDDSNNNISSNSPPMKDNTLHAYDSPTIDDTSIKPDLSLAIDEAPMTDING